MVQNLQIRLASQASIGPGGSLCPGGSLGFDRRGLKAQAGRPDDAIGGEPFGPLGAKELEMVTADGNHLGMAAQADVFALQGQFGLLPVEGLGGGQQVAAALDELHHGCPFQAVSQFASQFHAAGTGAHHGNSLQRPPVLAQLPNQLLELLHIGQGAKSQAVLLHPGDTKTVGGGPCGDHQSAEVQLAA